MPAAERQSVPRELNRRASLKRAEVGYGDGAAPRCEMVRASASEDRDGDPQHGWEDSGWGAGRRCAPVLPLSTM